MQSSSAVLGADQLLQLMKNYARDAAGGKKAISVGIINGEPVLDLDYSLDSRADVDMNIVMTGKGGLAEVQGTAEGNTFSRDEMNTMLDLAFGCNENLVDIQKRAIETPLSETKVRVTL